MKPKPTYKTTFESLLEEKRPLWENMARQASTRHTGVVKFFNRAKGYGFIVPDDGGAEVFVHYSGIVGDGYRNLYEHDRVSYTLVDKGRGPQAQNVRQVGAVSQEVSE